jgi:hypothetical protein
MPSPRPVFLGAMPRVLSTVTVLIACPYANRLVGVIARVTVIGSPIGLFDGWLGFASKLGSDPSITLWCSEREREFTEI